MKYIIFGFLAIFTSTNLSASVTCKSNVMTTNKFCSSTTERSGSNYYFFATNDPGTVGRFVVSFGDLPSSPRPDGVMIKLDEKAPFKIKATSLAPDVNCRSGCVWSVAVVVTPSQIEIDKMKSANNALISFTQGSYVSEPSEIDPKKISGWFSEWNSLKNK